MAGWTVKDDRQTWKGEFAADEFYGDGSHLTGVVGTTYTAGNDLGLTGTTFSLNAGASTAIIANTAKISYTDAVQYQSTSAAYIAHASDGTIHYANPGFFDAQADVDHDQITNTHNLTSDIDHTTIQNIGIMSHSNLDSMSQAYSTHAALVNEHLDWTADLGATNINAGNYTNTTYTAGNDLGLAGGAFSLNAGVSTAVLANTAHAADASDPHGVTLTQTNISGTSVSYASIYSTSDHDTLSQAIVQNIVIGTGAVASEAITYPRGTIYIQYTP